MKRVYHGIYNKMRAKHLDRYVQDFEGRNNQRRLDIIDQMTHMARGMVGKRLGHRVLVAA